MKFHCEISGPRGFSDVHFGNITGRIPDEIPGEILEKFLEKFLKKFVIDL